MNVKPDKCAVQTRMARCATKHGPYLYRAERSARRSRPRIRRNRRSLPVTPQNTISGGPRPRSQHHHAPTAAS
ncbi:hypothetical protein EVAR_85013_1 [Eumeta japonica]|uniref:Uncharacterized protein n=1 Tax=Eumeta variegata TaxID=151549 RepID=A0A4C1W8M9_EUMVA|nr:hypothetical protein EVAR_85013_1 [Eumeta japonica]